MPDGAPAVTVADLLHAHYAFVYRVAYRLSGSAADAEDLTQQTYLQAQTHLSQLRETSRSRPWLASIVRNLFLRARRRGGRAVAWNPDWEPAADTEPPEKIDSESLQAAIDELPDEFRVPLVLFYFRELSYKDIAAELEIPLGTVMSRLARAKAHLREQLGTDDDDAPTKRPARRVRETRV
ncbi:MAG TPA: sigma-70 family RNA polymerase sigma factor [Planctomycetaceae bacterium]|jgi:RNA polymerase sigma-70 factor (ECF subfamily)|nr:sigma-70 family RNA polymerase sigma factor [Planctomycetaceae bacterium]